MTFSPICLSLPAVLFQSASDRRLFPVRCTKFIISNPHHSFYATFVSNIRYLAVYAILCYTDVYKTVKYFTCCFLSDILWYSAIFSYKNTSQNYTVTELPPAEIEHLLLGTDSLLLVPLAKMKSGTYLRNLPLAASFGCNATQTFARVSRPSWT